MLDCSLIFQSASTLPRTVNVDRQVYRARVLPYSISARRCVPWLPPVCRI